MLPINYLQKGVPKTSKYPAEVVFNNGAFYTFASCLCQAQPTKKHYKRR